jgi:hypothetical protein
MKFKYDAKVTHKRYGICKYAAILDIFLNEFIINIINDHNNIIQINENKYSPKLKNNIGQIKLTSNWMP